MNSYSGYTTDDYEGLSALFAEVGSCRLRATAASIGPSDTVLGEIYAILVGFRQKGNLHEGDF